MFTLANSIEVIQITHKGKDCRYLASESLEKDLTRRHGLVFIDKIEFVEDEEFLTATAYYSYRQYNGPTEGKVLIHKRILNVDITNEVYLREMEFGTKFVKTVLPGAYVTHCECDDCGGPVTQELVIEMDGNVIEFYVIFK
jgi:hypothetical protein